MTLKKFPLSTDSKQHQIYVSHIIAEKISGEDLDVPHRNDNMKFTVTHISTLVGTKTKLFINSDLLPHVYIVTKI